MAYTNEQITQISNRLTEISLNEYLKEHDEFLHHYPDVVRDRFDYDLARADRDNGLFESLGTATPVKAMGSYVAACLASLEQAAYEVCKRHGRRVTSQMGQELIWAIHDEGILEKTFNEQYLPQVPDDIRSAYEEECRRQGLPEDTALKLNTCGESRTYVPDPYPGVSEKDKDDYIMETNYTRTWQYNYDLQHPNENSRYKKERARRKRNKLLKRFR